MADTPVIPNASFSSGASSERLPGGGYSASIGEQTAASKGLVLTYNPYTHQYEYDPPNTTFLWNMPAQRVSPKSKAGSKNSKQQATIAGAGSVIPLLYGRRRVGGRIAGVQTYNGVLYILAVWCWGTTLGVDAVESFTVGNNTSSIDYTASHYLGNQTAADPTIQTAKRTMEGKNYFDIIPGVCYSVIGIDLRSISGGLPTVNAVIRGLKVASADGGTPAYSNCPAYIIADFITNADYGMGSKVNWSDVAALATYNNELIGPSGSQEVRNELDILLDTVRTKQDWLAILCDYAGCYPFKDGDTWRLIIDDAVDPGSIISLGATDLVQGSLKLTKKDIVNLPNVVEAIWTDSSKNPWADSTAVAYGDGVLAGRVNRRVSQLDLRGVLRYSEAYRYVVRRLNEATTADLQCQFTRFDAGLKMVPGDVFALTHPIGLTAKQFRCIKAEPTSPGRWDITGVEYDPAKYSDDVVSAPSTLDSTIASPFTVPDVTDLNVTEEVYQIQTGKFASRFNITWTGPSVADWVSGDIIFPGYQPLAGFDVQIIQGSNVTTHSVPFDQLNYVTGPMPENLPYTIQVRAKSALKLGAWSSFDITNSGKSALPSDVPSVTAYSTNGETRISWEAATDLDLTGYEIKWGSSSDTWDTATFVAFVATPATFYSTTIIPSGSRRVFIKALDSVRSVTHPNGQESANAAYVDVTVSPNATTSYTQYTPGAPTLTAMDALPDGTYVTDAGTTWNALFPSALNTYTNPLYEYSAGSSSLVSGSVDLGAETTAPATILSSLAYTDLSGTAQPYIEYSDDGSSWTRVNGDSAIATFRYVRVGISTTGSMLVTAVGTISVGVDNTQNYVQYSVLNDPMTFA